MSSATESADSQPLSPELQPPGRRSQLPLLVLIALFVAGLSYYIRPTAAISGLGPAVGHRAPPLTLVSIDFGEVSSSASNQRTVSFSERRVTLVHFWGTWCGPCCEELPGLSRLCGDLCEEGGFEFISVSCSNFDDDSLATLVRRTQEFYRSHQIKLPTYADPSRIARHQFCQLMGRDSFAYPTTVLIDREGVIRATWVGIPPGGVKSIRKRVLDFL